MLVAQQIRVLFAPPYQIAMESKVRLLATSGDSIALAGQRALAADGDLMTRGRYQAVYVTAFEAPDEATLLGKLAHEKDLGAWLRTQHAAQAVIGAAGTAVFVLAEAGLLDRGIAAIPREWSNLFRRRYPRIRLETRAVVAEHENVLSTGAPATEWQLVVKLVEYVTSLNSARWLSTRTGLSRTRGNTAEISEDPLVAAAQHWLGERFAQPFKITDMTRELAVSHSTLLRRFERSLSTTPRHYAQMLRMESAKLMLAKTNRSINTISTTLGYADTRSFRAAFSGYTSMSPTEYRTSGK